MTGGTVVVNGPTNYGNAAIDVSGSFDISGGTLRAAGSAGMAETPDSTTAQAWLSATFDATQPAGAVITIEAGDKVLATFTATKQLQSLVYSSAMLVAGDGYDVLVDGDEVGSVTASGQACPGSRPERRARVLETGRGARRVRTRPGARIWGSAHRHVLSRH